FGRAARMHLVCQLCAIVRAEIGDGVVVAVAVDHSVVARGDPAVVLGQIQLGIMVLARVAAADPHRQAVELLLPGAARCCYQQARHRRRADWRAAASAETRAGLVDSPTTVTGHTTHDPPSWPLPRQPV